MTTETSKRIVIATIPLLILGAGVLLVFARSDDGPRADAVAEVSGRKPSNIAEPTGSPGKNPRVAAPPSQPRTHGNPRVHAEKPSGKRKEYGDKIPKIRKKEDAPAS